MAYAVENGSRRFVGSGGVILVHVTLAYLLVFGLAVPEFIPPPVTRITSVPVTPPVEPPPPEEKRKEEPKTPIDSTPYTPPKPFEFTTEQTITTVVSNTILPPLDPIIPTVGGGRDIIEATFFNPIGAKPANNVERWVTTRDYPRIAISRGEHGITRFSVRIDARGNITDCSITRSSGSTALDDAVCKNVKKRAEFEPATDKYGAKVPGTYSHSVNWVLPE